MKRAKTLGGEQPWKRLEMAGLADGAVGDIMCLDISSESDHVETDVGYMSSQVFFTFLHSLLHIPFVTCLLVDLKPTVAVLMFNLQGFI